MQHLAHAVCAAMVACATSSTCHNRAVVLFAGSRKYVMIRARRNGVPPLGCRTGRELAMGLFVSSQPLTGVGLTYCLL